MSEQQYNQGGGYIPGPTLVTIHPDECVIARRDGRFVCVRAHEHRRDRDDQ